MSVMKICILGSTGMLGHMLFSELLRQGHEVFGTSRSPIRSEKLAPRILSGVDAYDFTSVSDVLSRIRPAVVINAIGLIRHLPEGKEHLPCIKINAEFPHLLWRECRRLGAKFIHYSTDCVFDGKAGRPYVETDRPTATDVYGMTKYLGEVAGEGALTVRTSIVGPELRGKHSLLEWFLAQNGVVRGFTGAIYTGLPTSEHARILHEHILPRHEMCGLYHVAAMPISKYELLRIIAAVYEKNIKIVADDGVQEDKRLSSSTFNNLTGYTPPDWTDLVKSMSIAHRRALSCWNK